MSKWMSLGGWLRAALVTLVAGVPTGQPRSSAQPLRVTAGQCAPAELAADVDGDGRIDRVRWRRYGDDYWLDVSLAQADGSFALRSSTRVAPVDGGEDWLLSARDLDADGRSDIVVQDGRGHARVWLSDGRGFTEAQQPALTRAAGEVALSQAD
jgi:hypothetical protein